MTSRTPHLLAAACLSLGIAGCATGPGSKEPGPAAVSVSAVNYSQLSDQDLYASVNAPANHHPEPPRPSVPMRAQYYLMLPGEVYESDMKMDQVYHELELALEPRRYFNVVYQIRAGHTPARIDYILRVHYGGRKWLIPSVRADRITWGNDGIVSSRYMTSLKSNSLFDPRVGLTQDEVSAVTRLMEMPKTGGITGGGGGPGARATPAGGEGPAELKPDEHFSNDDGMGDQLAIDYCLVVVEAFRFDDVKAMDKKARCAWATFVAVPVDRGRPFSTVVRGLLAAASPYFGTTTNGLQVYEVPDGKVLMGSPVEVRPPEKAPESSRARRCSLGPRPEAGAGTSRRPRAHRPRTPIRRGPRPRRERA
jgi:hypothetical protein